MSEDDSWPTWLKGAIASGLVGALATPPIELLLSYFGLSLNWLTIVSGLVVDFLTYKVAVWQMLAGIATMIGALALWGKISKLENPDWREYTSDRIKGVDWKWQWKGRKVTNLAPFCPKCSTQLKLEEPILVGENAQGYECPNCDFQGRWHSDTLDDVKLIIERNAREEEYET